MSRGGGKRMWLIWRCEQPLKGRRRRTVFVASIRATLPEARQTVANWNAVWAGDGLFGRDLRAHHIAIPKAVSR